MKQICVESRCIAKDIKNRRQCEAKQQRAAGIIKQIAHRLCDIAKQENERHKRRDAADGIAKKEISCQDQDDRTKQLWNMTTQIGYQNTGDRFKKRYMKNKYQDTDQRQVDQDRIGFLEIVRSEQEPDARRKYFKEHDRRDLQNIIFSAGLYTGKGNR
jgi:hypothetical protein